MGVVIEWARGYLRFESEMFPALRANAGLGGSPLRRAFASNG